MICAARVSVATFAAASLALGAVVLPQQASAATCPTGWGSLPKASSARTIKSLTNARTGRHDCYDRMVIDVPGASAARLGYSVRYVSRFEAEGSGRVIPVSGGAIIQVTVHAPAYNVYTGKPTYTGKVGLSLPGVNLTGYRTLRDSKYGGSFEGDTQFGFGVRARLPFRAMRTDGHIIVDVAHKW